MLAWQPSCYGKTHCDEELAISFPVVAETISSTFHVWRVGKAEWP